MGIFVSYSRAQFYFADDLALALREQGVDAWLDVHRLRPGDDWDRRINDALRASDAVVLVASRDALASPRVRAELELARQLGKPVVVGLAENVDLSGVLGQAARVDLRTGFEDKVRRLSAGLKGDDDTPTAGEQPSSSGRAGVVRMVSTTLLGTALLLGALALVLVVVPLPFDLHVAAFYVLFVAILGAYCGWLWWAFSHRWPGSAVLLGVTFAGSIPIGALLGFASVIILVLSPGRLAWEEALVSAIFLCLPVAWLWAALWALRSPSFYRWLPTGDAPRWMRRRMLSRRGQRPATAPGTEKVSYDIWCQEPDRPVERALDRALQAAGHRRAGGADADRRILVLSNLTAREGLADRLAQFGDRGIVVISAPVSLPALERAERFQWVDHRRRDRRTLDRLAASIGGGPTGVGPELVPENIERRVVPLGVLAPAVLCIVAAAWNLATGIAGIGGADIAEIFGSSQSRPRAVGVLLLGALALWIATALLARRIPLRLFLAGFVGVYLVTLATPKLVNADTPLWPAAPSAALCLTVLLLSAKTLAAWLPSRFMRSSPRTLAADVPAWWRRPAARGVVLYTAALTVLAIAAILPLQGNPLPTPSGRLVIGAGFTAQRPAGWRDESPQPRVYIGPGIVLARGDGRSRQEMIVNVPLPPLDGRPVDLNAFRERVVRAGAEDVTPAEPTEVDDEAKAIAFGYRPRLPDGQPLRRRKVVVQHGDFAFEITLTAPQVSYPDADEDLGVLLRSWQWVDVPELSP